MTAKALARERRISARAVASDQRRWHIGKEIPVAVLIVLVVQTSGVVWWASALSAAVSEASRKITALEARTEVSAQRLGELSSDTKVNSAKTDGVLNTLNTLQTQIEFIRQERRAVSGGKL